MKSFIAAVLFFFSGISLAGQQYTFRNDSKTNGLKNLGIGSLVQNYEGYIWVGTESGLYRYDGTRYELIKTVEGQDDAFITSISEDIAHRLWVTTLHSVLYLDSTGVHVVATRAANLDIDPRSALISMSGGREGVLFVSAQQLFMVRTLDGGKSWTIAPAFSNEQVRQHPELANVSGGVAAKDGHIWLGCERSICEWYNDTLRKWGDGLPEDRWRAILASTAGTVYARGEHHFFRLRPNQTRFEPIEQDLPKAALAIRGPGLVEDPQGRILANVHGGLARLEKGRWHVITAGNGFPQEEIQAMLFDRSGTLRLGTANAGVVRWLGYGNWESWTTQSGLTNNTVWSILKDEGRNLWIGNESGVDRLSVDSARPVGVSGLPARRVQTIVQTSSRHLWMGSDDGRIMDYSQETHSGRQVARIGSIFQMFLDRSNRMWVSSANGLFYFLPSDGTIALRRVPDSEIAHGNVYRTVQDAEGTLWSSTATGIYWFDGRSWSSVSFPISYQLRYSADLAIAQDGSFWMATVTSGLVHWRMNHGHAEVLGSLDLSTNLSPYLILVQIDRRGWLWVGTDSGLAVFNGEEWRCFTEEDGLIWNDTDSTAFYSDPDGSVWIGTSGGLSHILHPGELFARQPLSVRVTDVEVGDQLLPTDMQTRVLPWGYRTLRFHVAPSILDRASLVKYRYKLEGLEDKPSETSDHSIHYPPLAAGHYRLIVTVVDQARNEESKPTFVAFTILPPWWRSGGFYGLAAIASLLFGIFAWRWSSRLVIARKNQLENLVKKRTRELETEKASLVNARAALVEQATHDSLTGLLNRGSIFSELDREMERAHRDGHQFPVILADIDHFKRINDTYGHLVGDHVLREFAARLKNALRPYDRTGRYGGEEFLILMPSLSGPDYRGRIVDLHEAICLEPMTFGKVKLEVTCSFGVAWSSTKDEFPESIVDAADQALYRAKENGRNRIEISEERAAGWP